MFLIHSKIVEIGTLNSDFEGFDLLRRLRKKFPRGDIHPQAVSFTAHTNPLLLDIKQKNIRLEHEEYKLKKDFYIGIINPNSRYPLIIKSIRVKNVNFYTDKYLQEEHFNF